MGAESTKPQENSRRRQLPSGLTIVIASFFITAAAFGTQYAFGVFFKPLQQDFIWATRATISGVVSLNLLAYGGFALLAGWATDRYGPRAVVALGGFFIGLGLLLSSRVNAIWQLYLLFGLPLAIGLGAAWNPLVTTASRWFTPKRGLALGIIAAGVGTGTMVMLPVAERLVSAFGWRTSFLIMGLITWAIIIPFALLLRRAPSPTTVGNNTTAASQSERAGEKLRNTPPMVELTLRQALQTRNLLLLFSMQLLSTLALRMIMVHLVPHATDIGLSAAAAALLVGFIGGSSIVGRIVMGIAQDKIGPKKAFLLCSSLQALSLIWLTQADTVGAFYLFAAIFGFTYGGDVPQLPALIGESFGLRHMGSIYGIITLAVGVGGSAGPILAGYIFDTSHSYTLAFWIGAIAMFLASLFAFFLKSPQANSQGVR